MVVSILNKGFKWIRLIWVIKFVKKSGSEWEGYVVDYYSTKLTPDGILHGRIIPVTQWCSNLSIKKRWSQ